MKKSKLCYFPFLAISRRCNNLPIQPVEERHHAWPFRDNKKKVDEKVDENVKKKVDEKVDENVKKKVDEKARMRRRRPRSSLRLGSSWKFPTLKRDFQETEIFGRVMVRQSQEMERKDEHCFALSLTFLFVSFLGNFQLG